MTRQPSSEPAFRVGHGYDLHRLEFDQAGPGLVLGGITIPHPVQVKAHSDGDALLHAITDALLGALGEADIGQLFPDDEKANKGRDSQDFLRAAMERVRARSYAVSNLDCTVILEKPKLAPHKDAMCVCIAEILGASVSQVNIKGKTGEGIGPIGAGLAVEVHVVVLLARI